MGTWISDELGDTVSVGLAPPLPSRQLSTASTASTAPEEGPILAGRYRLLALLGAGGMGSVYRVRDLELDEIVALKMLRRESLSAPGMLARFRQEVKLARRVTHKNVARTFDIGEHESEKFLTMEYVEGSTLSRVIDENRASMRQALQIVRAIAEGLHAAHEAAVIHLDLKPDNVMVQTTGRVVITDFGIARLGAGSHPSKSEWVGTPAYMAPEQVEGRSDLDARCDLYALGEVLYELLTGRPAWSGPNPIACAAARLVQEPQNPCTLRPELPARLGELVMGLLARKREDRFESAAEVIAALDASDPRERSSAPLRAPSARDFRKQRAHEVAVAVLPFRNEGAADDYLSDGIGDDLLDTLSTTQALRVRPRSMIARFKGNESDPRELGRELGVDVVVEGSLRRLGADSFRLVIRVLSVADGFQLWAQRFDATTADLLVVSDHAARAIGEALAAQIVMPVRKVASDPVAIDLYLRAREELRRRGYGNDVDDAIPLLEEALHREPDEPNLLAAYAIARSRISQSAAGLLVALESAERATTLAPHLAEGWRALASVRMTQADFAGAIHACARALDCSPHLAEAHHLLGDVMYPIGWTEAAVHRSTLALTLDPSLRGPAITLAVVHGLAGDYDRADAMLLDPSLGDPPIRYIAIGTRCRLATWRRITLALEDLPDLDSPAVRVARVFQACASGTVDWKHIENMRSARTVASPMIASFIGQVEAEACAFAGDPDGALAAIELAVEQGLIDVAWMDHLPLFAEMRRLERFQVLRSRIEERAALLRRILVDAGFDEHAPRR